MKPTPISEDAAGYEKQMPAARLASRHALRHAERRLTHLIRMENKRLRAQLQVNPIYDRSR